MKQLFRKFVLILLSLALLGSTALAETISVSGVVTASDTCEVYAESTGTLESVYASVGQHVSAGDVLAAMRTTKVYAEEDGVVTAVFGAIGDSADTVSSRYGAVISMEGRIMFTIAASTEKAYDSVDTKLVHVGETVLLRSRSDETHTGVGMITAVDGTSYTVYVTDGSFITGENVNIYRGSEYDDTQRIGRGDISRNAPVSVTGSGRIISVAVAAGDQVSKGDLLFETLPGSGTSAQMTTPVSGVVAELNAVQGNTIDEGAVAAVIWPDDAMQIEAAISEADLMYFSVGDAVEVRFDWNEDVDAVTPATVASISAVADAGSDNTVFTAVIEFVPDETVRYGMNVTISTIDSID